MTMVKKILIIIASACVILGGAITLGTYLVFHNNMSLKPEDISSNVPVSIDSSETMQSGTATYEIKRCTIDDSFDNINVNIDGVDVDFELSSDGICRVIFCDEVSDDIVKTAEVTNGTLNIVHKDNRPWTKKIGVYLDRKYIDVQLPKEKYEKLVVKVNSANVEVSDKLSFTDAQISASSGDIEFSAVIDKSLAVKASSGDIDLENMTAGSSISVSSSSGDIDMTNVNTSDLNIESTSGEVELEKVVAQGSMKIKTTSGDIDLRECDADYLNLKSTSGDVYGSLLSEKSFIASSASGDVHVPYYVSDKRCEIQTTSGSIRMSVK